MHAWTPSSTACSRKWRAVEALAHESGIPVGKDREDRIDLAFADQRFERTAIESAGHEADSSASPQRVSSCTPCRDRRVARSWRGRCTTSPTRRSPPSCWPRSIPAYYANAVVGNADGRGDFWWGLAVSTSMVLVALTSPLFGGIADHAGVRKPLLRLAQPGLGRGHRAAGHRWPRGRRVGLHAGRGRDRHLRGGLRLLQLVPAADRVAGVARPGLRRGLRRRLRGLARRVSRGVSVRCGEGLLGLLPRRRRAVRALGHPGVRRAARSDERHAVPLRTALARGAREIAGHATRDPARSRPARRCGASSPPT